MSILDRISRLIKSNVNDLIDKAEDPEKMAKQIIEELNQHLVEAKTQTASAIATLNQLEKQAHENADLAQRWQAKAELAVSKGDDDLAREALARKKTYQTAADGLQAQVDQQKKQVEQLKSALCELEARIAEAQAKKDLLVARHHSAQANAEIQRTMSKVDASGALSALDRMQQKVDSEEAQASAWAELSGDSLEDKFKKLESHPEVDDELAALKAKLGKS